MNSLWHRIRQRKIVQWALAYLAGGWLVLQVLDVLGQNLGWQTWVFRVTIALLAVGFLAALVLAWYHGEKGRQQVSGMEVLMLAGILVIAGGVVALVRGEVNPTPDQAASAEPNDSVASDRSVESNAAPHVAVLPFHNLSGDPEAQPFTNGLHDDIITQLSKVSALRVISRTSVLEYRETARNLREIGDELGVQALLEGGVQRAGENVRVNVQLIDAETDEHLWAERFDRVYSVENIFAIQSEIARNVARSLAAELSPKEQEQVASVPTRSEEAYAYFVRAEEYRREYLGYRDFDENLENAIQLYRRAVEEDPGFALAWSRLSEALTRSSAREGGRASRAKEAVDRALGIAPDLPQGHAALGLYHYLIHFEVDRAMEELRKAQEALPNDVEILRTIAYVERDRARYPEARRNLERAVTLDPKNHDALVELSWVLLSLRRYAEAVDVLRRSITLAPDVHRHRGRMLTTFLSWTGDIDRSWEEAWAGFPENDIGMTQRINRAYWNGDLEEALRLTEEQHAERGSEVSVNTIFWAVNRLFYGDLLRASGRLAEANVRYDSVRVYLEKVTDERPIRASPGTRESWAYRRAYLARAYAGLGREEEAVAAMREAIELHPVPPETGRLREQFARVYAMIDEPEASVATLEEVFSHPGRLGPGLLLADPSWNPLRAHPGFEALLEKTEKWLHPDYRSGQ